MDEWCEPVETLSDTEVAAIVAQNDRIVDPAINVSSTSVVSSFKEEAKDFVAMILHVNVFNPEGNPGIPGIPGIPGNPEGQLSIRYMIVSKSLDVAPLSSVSGNGTGSVTGTGNVRIFTVPFPMKKASQRSAFAQLIKVLTVDLARITHVAANRTNFDVNVLMREMIRHGHDECARALGSKTVCFMSKVQTFADAYRKVTIWGVPPPNPTPTC